MRSRGAGYSHEELLGMRVSDLEARELPEDTAAHMIAIRDQGVDLFESVLRAKDGTTWPIEASAAYWPGGGGRILAFQRDITSRKQTEVVFQQRLALQAQLAKIAEAVPGAIYTIERRPDKTMCFPYTSAAAEDVLGLSRELLARDAGPGLANIHPEDLPWVMQSIEQVARTRTVWHGEFRYLHPKKGERWLEGWSAPRIEANGQAFHHGYLTDVTERKHVEEALRDSEAKLQTIVETAVDAIITIDDRGTVLSFNSSAARARSVFQRTR